jgi:O-antigen/teichoic acid export membrane protein
MFSALGSGLDGVSQLLPVALIAATYGAAHGGQYALADRAMRMPSVLLGSSLAQVFYQRLAISRSNPQECHRLLRRTWSHLALLGILPLLVAIAIGPWLFATVFGSRWREAGEAARALAPGLFAYFVAFPTSNSIVVFERLGLLLIWQVTYVAVVWAVFSRVPVVFQLSPLGTLWTFSGALTVLYGASLYLQWHVVNTAISPSDAVPLDPSFPSTLSES